jgi:hypothetical protein
MYIVGVDDISLCFLLFVTFCQNTATLTDIIIVSSRQLIGLDLCIPSLPLTFSYLFASDFDFQWDPPPHKYNRENQVTLIHPILILKETGKKTICKTNKKIGHAPLPGYWFTSKL